MKDKEVSKGQWKSCFESEEFGQTPNGEVEIKTGGYREGIRSGLQGFAGVNCLRNLRVIQVQ